MKTILVVAQNTDLADNLRSGLDPAAYRVAHRAAIEDAEPLLLHGLADVCLVDLELRGVQDAWLLERLCKRSAHCPLIVCTGERSAEWEEQAYLQGVSHILHKPLRVRTLEAILQQQPVARATTTPVSARPAELREVPVESPAPAVSTAPTLALLRDFSSILTHSDNAEELLKQLLLLLRQICALNRAAIFLHTPNARPGSARPGAERELRAIASIGLAPEIVARAQLSLDRGLGAELGRLGRVMRVNSPEVRADPVLQSEFEILGARVAVPMLDRGALLGVVLADGRLTGEPLVNSELELIFHLLEQAALAVRHIWLHDQQAANHELLTGVLRELSSACVVVGRDLKILHANKMAQKYFGAESPTAEKLDFTELPPVLATKIHQVLRTGGGLRPFRFEPAKPVGAVFQVTIVPFQRDADGSPGSVLLTVEDQTQNEQLRRLELEASDLRMVKSMAHRLVAETGNAIVPLNTFVQIPPDAMDKNLLHSMLPALKDTDKRIERRVKQFRYLAEDVFELKDTLTLNTLVEKAYTEAQHYQPARDAQLILENTNATVTFTANRERLVFALAEVFMNALQANPAHPIVTVRRVEAPGPVDGPMLAFEIHDNGAGFSQEAFEKVGKHFFTTRIPGLGLGLAVARKIVEAHGGLLEISAPGAAPHGLVCVLLPLRAPVAAKE